MMICYESVMILVWKVCNVKHWAQVSPIDISDRCTNSKQLTCPLIKKDNHILLFIWTIVFNQFNN